MYKSNSMLMYAFAEKINKLIRKISAARNKRKREKL